MKTVWKYRLNTYGSTPISLPRGATPLYIAERNIYQNTGDTPPYYELFVWIMVDTSESMVTRNFHVLRTGTVIPQHSVGEFGHLMDECPYIGTILDSYGDTLHAFG